MGQAASEYVPRRVYLGTDDAPSQGTGTVRRAVQAVGEDLAALRHYRYVLYYLIATNLKIRYQRSFLGLLWTVLHPALNLVVLAIVFSQIIGRGIPNYHVYLFSGLLPYMAFSEVLTLGSKSLILNEGFLRKTDVPKLLFPLQTVGVAIANFLCAMVALFFVLQLFGAQAHVQLVILLPATVLLFVFNFGISLIFMTLLTYFRDFEHIIQVMVRALYFLCPIIVQPQQLGPYAFVMEVNPLTYILQLFRHIFYLGTWPPPMTWGISTSISLLLVFIGYVIYKRHEHDYIYRL
jgi:ABC-type polysaccharide/polyol phosphate export permease